LNKQEYHQKVEEARELAYSNPIIQNMLLTSPARRWFRDAVGYTYKLKGAS